MLRFCRNAKISTAKLWVLDPSVFLDIQMWSGSREAQTVQSDWWNIIIASLLEVEVQGENLQGLCVGMDGGVSGLASYLEELPGFVSLCRSMYILLKQHIIRILYRGCVFETIPGCHCTSRDAYFQERCKGACLPEVCELLLGAKMRRLVEGILGPGSCLFNDQVWYPKHLPAVAESHFKRRGSGCASERARSRSKLWFEVNWIVKFEFKVLIQAHNW